MRRVHITGVGLSAVGEHFGRSLAHLASEAIEAAVTDAEGAAPRALFVGSAFSGALAGQEHLGAYLADRLGLAIEVHRVEAEGASGAAALRLAELLVGGGALECVLVLGVEKVSDALPDELEQARSRALDEERDAAVGLTPAAVAALLMARYQHDHRLPRGALSPFPRLAHAHALTAPHAFLRRPLTAEEYAAAEPVAAPLGVMDCAPVLDGAAALVVQAAPGPRGVRIAGSAVAQGPLALAARPEPHRLDTAARSAAEALSRSGRARAEVSLFELDDAYSILAALSLEAVGFCDRGLAPRDAEAGRFGLGGELPVCTFGGSKARGNPIGAAGVYRVAEAVRQLRGEAGDNQVRGAKVALAQSLGALGATAITHVLE